MMIRHLCPLRIDKYHKDDQNNNKKKMDCFISWFALEINAI